MRYFLPLILIIAAACVYVIENNETETPIATTSEVSSPIEYDRRLYKHWVDQDKDCQDTRQEVLISESIEPVILDDKGCRVVSGLWEDTFTGNTYTDPSDLDIDHMVPLKEAHLSGAHLWSLSRREQYANDLSHSDSLIAVSKSANQSKGAKDVAQWLPTNEAFHCEYVKRWVGIKDRWGMTMDVTESDAVTTLLEEC